MKNTFKYILIFYFFLSPSALLSQTIKIATIGAVINLIDGAYSWYFTVIDWAGNIVTSVVNLLTIL